MKRLHVHVAVDDLETSKAFYATLFGAAPSVVKDDYAKWMLEDPRVNFAISSRGRVGGLDHLGIQVDSAEELADIALMAAAEVRRFGLPPKVAFLSHSIFGSSSRASAQRMRAAHALFRERAPEIESDGEMQGDAALSETVRRGYLPETTLAGTANLLLLPNLDAANILFNVLKMTGSNGLTVGPILLGAARPVHILTPSATVRRIVNMTALAVADVAAVADEAGARAAR